MNALEKVIEFISPAYALERERARKHVQMLRGYDAAKKGRRTNGWNASGQSANAEVYQAAAILRNRSRELCRNNPYVKRAVQSIANNTIGTGIRAKITGRSKAALHKAWIEWADKSVCDFNGIHNFYGLQKLVMRTVIEAGDCLIIRRRNSDNRVPIELQVVEIEYLDTNKNSTITNSDGSFTFMGIEFDRRGKRKGYWIYDKHPNEVFTYGIGVSKFVPASDVIHVFEQLRAGQMLGVPFGVSSFLRVRDMDEYNDAQVVRQKIAACYSVFITTNNAGTVADTQAKVDEIERIEPGMISVLNGGEQVSFGTPPSVENFAEFSRTIMQGVAAGFGTTYENLTGDLNNVNFSSGRMGWIEHHRNIEDWQWNLIIPQFCDKVAEWFMDAAQLAGVGSGNGVFEWTPPRREMIDPVKEGKALMQLVRGGFMSLRDAIREQGYDPEEVFAEIAQTNKELDALGIILDSDPRHGRGEGVDGRGRPSTDAENIEDNVDKK
jgi:lambda family phage portal protein